MIQVNWDSHCPDTILYEFSPSWTLTDFQDAWEATIALTDSQPDRRIDLLLDLSQLDGIPEDTLHHFRWFCEHLPDNRDQLGLILLIHNLGEMEEIFLTLKLEHPRATRKNYFVGTRAEARNLLGILRKRALV